MKKLKRWFGFRFQNKNCPVCNHKMGWKEENYRKHLLMYVFTTCRSCKSILVYDWDMGEPLDSGNKDDKLPSFFSTFDLVKTTAFSFFIIVPIYEWFFR